MYRVLIVDDEQIVKLAVKSMIDWTSEEFQLVGTASDGIAALKVMERNPVDILITDLKMPRMDGLSLIRAVQATAAPPAVLVLSNHSDFELVREALRLGAKDYLLKTDIAADVLSQSLRAAVRDHLPSPIAAPFSFLVTPEEGAEAEIDRVLAEISRESDRFAVLVGWPDNALNLVVSLMEQGLKACRRCVLVQRTGGGSILVMLIAEAEARPEAMAEWLVDQARLYYGTELSLVSSPLVADRFHVRPFLAEAQRTADLFFYSDLRGRALALGPVAAAEAPSEPVLTQPLGESVRRLVAWGARNQVSPRYLKKLVVSALGAVAGDPMEALILKCRTDLELIDLFVQERARVYRSEVQKVIDHIQSRPSDRIAVRDLATLVRMNETYLCTVFKAQTGKSIVQYINDAKLDRAKDLLATGRLLVKEVAAAVGIDDPFYFNRLFHRRFGVAPSQFRP